MTKPQTLINDKCIKKCDILDTSNNINIKNLTRLISRIKIQACYDKVGEHFYPLEKKLEKSESISIKLVNDFLDDLKLRKATSATIGYTA